MLDGIGLETLFSRKVFSSFYHSLSEEDLAIQITFSSEYIYDIYIYPSEKAFPSKVVKFKSISFVCLCTIMPSKQGHDLIVSDINL